MSKANGKFIVGGFVVMLGAAVGVAQVYLPYYSPQSEKRRDQNTLGKEQKEVSHRSGPESPRTALSLSRDTRWKAYSGAPKKKKKEKKTTK